MSEELSYRLAVEQEARVVKWTIENFNLIPHVVGSRVLGPTFSIGTRWQLLLYAYQKIDGSGLVVTDFILCLMKLGKEHHISAEMKAVIQNARGSQHSCSPVQIIYYSEAEENKHYSIFNDCSGSTTSSGSSWPPLPYNAYWLELNEINLRDYLENNALLVIVTITVVLPKELLNNTSITLFKQPSLGTPTSLVDDLKKLYINQELCDFTLKAGNDEILAHKAILAARSPVFAAMLQHDTEESKSNCVVIQGVSAEVIKSMLLYMYTGQMEAGINVTVIPTLYSAADRYQMDGLKEICSQFLAAHLDVENVCFTYKKADEHNDEHLRKAAEKFIVQNSASVLQSKGWEYVLSAHVMLAGQMLRIIAENQQVKR